jgi:hypothetical protein
MLHCYDVAVQAHDWKTTARTPYGDAMDRMEAAMGLRFLETPAALSLTLLHCYVDLRRHTIGRQLPRRLVATQWTTWK